jgi:putative sigma-54 modulation protein
MQVAATRRVHGMHRVVGYYGAEGSLSAKAADIHGGRREWRRYTLIMNINLQGTGVPLTPAISDYVAKKLEALEKFVENEGAVSADAEVGKTTDHHKSGDIFRAEVNLHVGGTIIRAVAEAEDLYAAIDAVKDELSEELRRHKDKRESMLRKGGETLKEMLHEDTESQG